VEHRLKPNLPVVGRKYTRRVPAIARALESLQGEAAAAVAHNVEAGRPSELHVDGDTFRLEPDEVLITTTSPHGYEVRVENDVLVALNTTLTPDLRLEGRARDLVRFIQDARKTAGCAITDRIHVTLEPHGDLELETVLSRFGEYIRSETLADSLAIAAPGAGAHVTPIDLEDGTATVGLEPSRPSPETG
jgi:isoleucyl-tRNA synthetase